MKRAGKGENDSSSANDAIEEKLTVDGGITKKILREGKGGITVPDDVIVKVHYIGRLADGTVFDESYKRKKPFEFSIGKRNVILGWDVGVKSMKIGEVAILKCASDYAYGKNGIGPIPPNSTLYFEVELLDWKKDDDSQFFYAFCVVAVLSVVFYVFFTIIYPRKEKTLTI
mmetsp:Transcript_21874/g.23843  ORF Transcript_21874/g.23843 Transcript_21874/m.23843 type:complete len:171 (-) Transcript_21874:125-637(-)